MESQKIYLAGNSGNGGATDPTSLLYASMMNNGGFGGNNGWWWLFLLLFARGGFGFGENGNLQSQLSNDRANDWVLQAINGNRSAIENLASTLNCDISAIQNTLCQIGAQIHNVAAKTELSGAQIINAIQAGTSQVMNMLASCCCDLKGIMNQGFSSLGYALRDQTCELEKAIGSSTAQILAGQAAIEKRELQREIATLQEEKQTCKLGSMIAAATNPIVADLEAIKCRLPKTEVIPATPEYVAINRSINLPYCGYGFGGFSPFGAGWNNGCGSGSLWG